MKSFDCIDEANALAKLSLCQKQQKSLVEARILGQKQYKKLYFFFESVENVSYFERNKEQIKEKLRAEYRKKLALYKQMGFIFYDIEAKLSSQSQHRSKEEEQRLERGIAKLKAIVDKGRSDKIAKISAILDKNKITQTAA